MIVILSYIHGIRRHTKLKNLSGLHHKPMNHLSSVDIPQDNRKVTRPSNKHSRIVSWMLGVWIQDACYFIRVLVELYCV